MDKKKNELPPACQLANLPTIFTMLSRRASRLSSRSYSCRSLVSPAIPLRPHRILVSLVDRRGGAVFHHSPVSSAGSVSITLRAVFPSSFIPPFRHAVLSLVSPGVCNVIFFYLTLRMLNTKKQC